MFFLLLKVPGIFLPAVGLLKSFNCYSSSSSQLCNYIINSSCNTMCCTGLEERIICPFCTMFDHSEHYGTMHIACILLLTNSPVHHIYVLTPSEGHFQVGGAQCPGYAYTGLRKRPEPSSFSRYRYRYRYGTLLKLVYGMYVRNPPHFKICAMLARMLCDVYICYLEFSVLWIQHESIVVFSCLRMSIRCLFCISILKA